MKKVLSVLLVLCCLLALASCGAGGSSPDSSTANKIVYGARYVRANTIEKPDEEQTYYVIYKDRIEYHYYSFSESYGTISHYTTTYKYTVMDEGTLAYFYDSIETHDNHTSNATPKNDYGLLLFSKNVLSTPSGTLFVLEDYAENQLPNFRVE